MFQCIDHPQVQAATAEPIRKLMYRGTAYVCAEHSVPQQPSLESTLFIGQRLKFRGTTYEIVPTSNTEILESTFEQELRYRGTDYMRRETTHPSYTMEAVA